MEGKLTMFLTLVYTVFCVVQVSGEDGRNEVRCHGSNQVQTIDCGSNEIIDIHSVTIAIVENPSPCTVGHVTSAINSLPPECKSSEKTSERTDGAEIYKSCHGQRSCNVDDSSINQNSPLNECTQASQSKANVVHFKYSCIEIDEGTTVLLPSNLQVSGEQINIFSPYYPCKAPWASYYEITYKFIPHRKTTTTKPFTITPKLVSFPATNRFCGDYILFMTDTGDTRNTTLGHRYCSSDQYILERWNDGKIVNHTYGLFEIKYRVYHYGFGGIFWFQISATENSWPIALDVTVTGQEGIPQQARSCTPLNFTVLSPSPPPPPPSPTPPTTTTTTLTTSATKTTTKTTTTAMTTEPPSTTTTTKSTSSATTPTTTKVSAGQSTTITTSFTEAVDAPKSGNGTEEKKSNTNTLLLGVLGAVIGLIIIVACIAVFLFFKIRKRNKEAAQQKKVPPKPPPKPKPRPKSIKKFADLVAGKTKAPTPDEEKATDETQQSTSQSAPPRPSNIRTMAPLVKSKRVAPNPGATETVGAKQSDVEPTKPSKPPRPSSFQKRAALMKVKGKDSSSGDKDSPAAFQKPPRPPRPNSIMKMAALIKNKKKVPNVDANRSLQAYATLDRSNKKEHEDEATALRTLDVYATFDKRKNVNGTVDGQSENTAATNNTDPHITFDENKSEAKRTDNVNESADPRDESNEMSDGKGSNTDNDSEWDTDSTGPNNNNPTFQQNLQSTSENSNGHPQRSPNLYENVKL